jgi:hypothetical protein
MRGAQPSTLSQNAIAQNTVRKRYIPQLLHEFPSLTEKRKIGAYQKAGCEHASDKTLGRSYDLCHRRIIPSTIQHQHYISLPTCDSHERNNNKACMKPQPNTRQRY